MSTLMIKDIKQLDAPEAAAEVFWSRIRSVGLSSTTQDARCKRKCSPEGSRQSPIKHPDTETEGTSVSDCTIFLTTLGSIEGQGQQHY